MKTGMSCSAVGDIHSGSSRRSAWTNYTYRTRKMPY